MLVYELSDDINHMKNALNMDISLKITCKTYKFSTCIHER